MRPEDILVPTPAGVCCKLGGFHIDPTRPVERALITHGHSDHARAGHGAVLATQETLRHDAAALRREFRRQRRKRRLTARASTLGGVKVTFHPAGHVLGSAQIAVEPDGPARRRLGRLQAPPDPTCPPFEPVPCDVFITEATFGAAGLPPRRRRRRDRASYSPRSRSSPSAPTSSAPIRSARRSA